MRARTIKKLERSVTSTPKRSARRSADRKVRSVVNAVGRPQGTRRAGLKAMTVTEAIKTASREFVPSRMHSHFKVNIDQKSGGKFKSGWRHNLTTTTATGYTNAYDWLAAAMGSGPSAAFATIFAFPVSTTTINATSVTNSAAAFPTSGNGLSGQIVVVFGLGNSAIVYGVILSNTATALTVDQWYSPSSTTGAAGTTPTTSGGSSTTGIGYCIVPGQNPAAWMCLSASTFTPATTDQSLGTQGAELTTNGFSRAVGTWAHSHAGSTYTLIHLWTATGTSTINNEGISGAATYSASSPFGGVFPFESAEPSPPTLVSGDTLQNTVTITI
jgi:hypothetical protein